MNYYNIPPIPPDPDRFGVPLTEEQRTIRHEALTGEPTPPPRGTRKAKARIAKAGIEENNNLFLLLILLTGGLLAGEIYIAWKSGIFAQTKIV